MLPKGDTDHHLDTLSKSTSSSITTTAAVILALSFAEYMKIELVGKSSLLLLLKIDILHKSSEEQ